MKKFPFITLGTGLLIVGTFFAANVSALTVTPMQGQTPEQIQKDQADCSAMAQQSAPQAPTATGPSGTRLKGAAVGAAAGAVSAEVQGRGHSGYDVANDDLKQEYRQNQAKSAAAAGMVVGGAKQRHDRREQSQQGAATAQSYDQAFGSCMMGRGYNVQ